MVKWISKLLWCNANVDFHSGFCLSKCADAVVMCELVPWPVPVLLRLRALMDGERWQRERGDYKKF
jgi:hypothetical protein